MNEKKLTFKDYLKAMGPGAIMSAAIIGPGTVTTASTQGASYGYTSLWILLLACLIAYFFQEPATRISIGCKESVMVGVKRAYFSRGSEVPVDRSVYRQYCIPSRKPEWCFYGFNVFFPWNNVSDVGNHHVSSCTDHYSYEPL